jgi:serine carboxypeptidase 1
VLNIGQKNTGVKYPVFQFKFQNLKSYDLKTLDSSPGTHRSTMFSTFIFVLCTLTVVYTQQIPDEKWSYVNVRKDAFMFWWLYGAQTANPDDRVSKPLVLWIQGGPGASGTGFGNFEELGPEDINGNKREYTWLKAANVLFVDNPVGSGFSYVTDDSAYTTNVTGWYSWVSYDVT